MTAVLEQRAVLPSGHYRFSGVIRSEWTKLWSVRSTLFTLLVTAIVTIVFDVININETNTYWASMSADAQAAFDPTGTSLTGVIYSQLVIGVLGVLVITSEYATGTIRVTFAASPGRRRVIAAKALVLVVVATVFGEILAFAAFIVGQALIVTPVPHSTLADHEVLRAVFGSGLILTLLGLLAMGLGTIIRNTAGALTVYVGLLLLLPPIVASLPPATQDVVSKFVPATIAHVMTSPLAASATQFTAWGGLGMLCLYAAVALAVGVVLIRRRDV
jgi:ABC-2 type transport system permease protein